MYLIRMIIGYSPGNETMRRIAGAIEEGAKAYLNRQILTVSIIAVVIFFVARVYPRFFYGTRISDWRMLLDGRGVYRDADSSHLELSYGSSGNHFNRRCVAGSLQRRSRYRAIGGRVRIAFGRDLFFGG